MWWRCNRGTGAWELEAREHMYQVGRKLKRAMKVCPAASFVAGLSFGCATLSPQPKFTEVQAAIGERVDRRVEWRGVTAADAVVDGEIEGLLNAPLTADSAVQIALLNNAGLQATYEELGIAQADLVEAGLLRNPVFEVQYRLPGRPANPYELHVVQDFIDVFFIPLKRKVAAAELEATTFRVADAVLKHAAETRQAFYRLQSAQQLVDMRGTVLEATEASALVAQRQREAGNISDLDLANEQALYEQTKVDLMLAKAKALEEREGLNELMGLSVTQASSWTIGGQLAEPLPESELEFEHLESLALSQRLDLQSANKKVEALAQSLGLARSSALVKSLDVGAHVEREPDGPATWGPSIGVPLPIFNQGRPEIARVGARLRQGQQEYLALSAKIGAEVRAARNRMVMAASIAGHYKSVMLPLRQQIVSESQLHYNAMQIGPAQLLQAKQAQLEAGARYIEALETYWVASADLERAQGGRLDFRHTGEADEVQPDEKPADSQEPHHHGGHQ